MIGEALTAVLAGTLLAAAPASATAEPESAPGEVLGRCMVLKSTGADRLLVARWFVAATASAPQAADVATVRSGRKDELDRAMAALFTRLLATDCADEARPLFAAGAGSEAGFRVAGEALGRVAIGELLGNQAARTALSAYTKYLRPEDFRKFAR